MTDARDISVAGTYAVDVRPLSPGNRYGAVVLRSGDAWMDGTLVRCRAVVAAYALQLAGDGEQPAVTLDRHGNVTSVQTADGRNQVKFPRRPENEEG